MKKLCFFLIIVASISILLIQSKYVANDLNHQTQISQENISPRDDFWNQNNQRNLENTDQIVNITLGKYYQKYFYYNKENWAYFQIDNDVLPSMMNYSMRCGFYGEDICVINGKEIQNATLLTIGVQCRESCEYKVQAEITQELYFPRIGKSNKLFFQAHQQRIIRFNIPDWDNITSVEIKGINENKYAKFEMLMTKGNNLPSTDNSLYLRPAWENGYVGKFTNDCQCFCKGCNYTVLISTEDEGYITISAKTDVMVVDLTSSQGITYDSVLYYHIQWYSFNVTDASKSLLIKLEVYSGDPDVYVNPKTLPTDYLQSTFNSKDHFSNEELILSPTDRQIYPTGLYYIGVFGKTSSTYKISIQNKDESIHLKSGLSESGYINYNKTKFYYFRDPILAQQDVNISFQLHVMTGGARLRTILCQLSEFDDEDKMKQKCLMNASSLFENDPNEKIMSHVGAEEEQTNTSMCHIGKEKSPGLLLNLFSKRTSQVSCVYIIGIAGLSQYSTHYSVMIKTNSKIEHTIMKEGQIVNDEMFDNTAKFFRFSINDPSVKKITIQLTTIHGDPDLFVSRSHIYPNYTHFEKRSVRCGIYPELVEYQKQQNETLMGDYYISVFGYVQSTFHLVYFAQTEKEASQISLMNSVRQRMVLHDTSESMIFRFKLSQQLKEDVEVRLLSENGMFKMYLGNGYVPDSKSFNYQGDEHNPIIFRQEQQSDSINKFTEYFVKVFPIQMSLIVNNQTFDSAQMAYIFTIAFYESGSFIHLSEGQPIRGAVENDTYDYYYIDLQDFDFNTSQNNQNSSIEITLTPISGDPDIVLSMNPSNEFPDHDHFNYISENHFTTDGLTITYDSIKDYQKLVNVSINFIYIGVYTSERTSTYTLLYTLTNSFTPIQLMNGQIQQGMLTGFSPHSKSNLTSKHYYFKTSSSMPIYASLIPQQGNPNMHISIINDLSLPMNKWKQYVQNPNYISEESFGDDIIYLNPSDQKFQSLCGSSCILLISVTNEGLSESHYTITVTRDITELTENHQIQDSIRDFGQYRYYKFFKSCGNNCDLEIQVTPLQVSQTLYLLADFEVKEKLPTHLNSGWSYNVKQNGGALIIKSNDKLFKQRNELDNQQSDSRGTFIIALHGHSNISYTLSVHTILNQPQITQNQTTQGKINQSIDNQYLDIRKVYFGESQPYQLNPSEIKYFYFENFNNASLKIQYMIEGKQLSSIKQSQIDMRISTVQGKKLPQYENEMPIQKWYSQKQYGGQFNKIFQDTIVVNHTTSSIQFCVHCYYIVRVENLDQNATSTMRLIVSQETNKDYGFMSTMVIGKPYNLRLSKGQNSTLSFHLGQLNGQSLRITSQIFNGEIAMYLYKGGILIEKSIGQDNFYSKFEEMIGIPTILISSDKLIAYQTYQLYIEAKEELHCSILVQQDHEISILPDGIRHQFKVQIGTSKYFLYVPPSQKFHMTISARAKTLHSNVTISIKKLSQSQLDDKNAEQNELIQTEGYRKKFKNDDHFDYIFRKTDTFSKLHIFKMIPIDLQNEDDLIMIKIDGYNDPNSINEQQISLDFFVSGSELQYIQANENLRGIVSNRENTYKIYEFYVNQQDLYPNQETDLYIEVTPCNGRIELYVSDDFISLFNNNSFVSKLDIQSFDKFGKTAKRIRNIQDLKIIYIGIESINEIYSFYENQEFSEYEISVNFIKNKQTNFMDSFIFERGDKQIQVAQSNKSQDEFIIKWGQIYQRTPEDSQTIQVLPLSGITYTLFFGSDQYLKYQFGAQCQIDHIDAKNVSLQFMSVLDQNEISMSRLQMANVKVIGIFAYVKDQFNGKLVTLSYEPAVISTYGTKFTVLNSSQKKNDEEIFIIALIATGIAILFAIIAVYLRVKGIKLNRRLRYEREHGQQVHDFSQEMQNVASVQSVSRISQI